MGAVELRSEIRVRCVNPIQKSATFDLPTIKSVLTQTRPTPDVEGYMEREEKKKVETNRLAVLVGSQLPTPRSRAP